MNTRSVSISRGIPESSKVEIKSKSNKEESFKDMIKNVSFNEKQPEKSSQVTKEESDFENPNFSDAQEDDGALKKDVSANVTDLAPLIMNSPCILDSVQLTKVVSLSSNVQAEGIPVADEQKNVNQTGLSEMITLSKPETGPTQIASALKGTGEFHGNEKTPLPNTTIVAKDGTNNKQPGIVIHQDIDTTPKAKEPSGIVSPNHNVAQGEQNKASLPLQETETLDSTEISTSELKISLPEGTTDDVITIKVGEPSLNSSWKQVAEEIGNMIVEKVNHEVQKVSITLNPKDLGEIDVEFFIDKGKISVSLICSNEGTKSLLATNMDSLTKIVQSSLMQDVNVNLNHDKADSQYTNSENFDGRGSNGHYQGDSQNKKKDQEQPNLDFLQRLRLGIEGIESSEV